MRELGEWDKGESRPDAAARHDSDSRQPSMAIVRDSATRAELTLQYRQRVKEVQNASGPADAATQDDQTNRVHRMSTEGDHASGQPPERDNQVRSDDHREKDGRSRDTAQRPAQGADLPASARELPNAKDVLPNLEMAEIDERKFSAYSLNPEHPDNKGKADGWRALGYDVDDPQERENAARELRDLTLDELLANGKVAEVREDSYGSRPRVISGITGPNGKSATLVTCWIIEDRSGNAIPRLVTTWVQPHCDREAGQ